MGLLKSEWIKVTSTRGAYWLYGLAIVLALGLAALLGQTVKSIADTPEMANSPGGGSSPLFALTGVPLFTMNLVWVAAIVAVTAEYRHNTIRTTFLSTPSRWPAVVSKAALFIVFGMAVTAITVVLSLLLGGALSGFDSWTPFSGEGLRYVWRYPVYAGLGVLAVVGLAHLMRNAAGAISLLFVWTLGVESTVVLIPKVGEDIQNWMPFLNGGYWVQGNALSAGVTLGNWGALAWYSLVCVLLFLAGLVLTLRRDA